MEKHRSVGLGVALILVGAVALLSALGVNWLSMDRLWPVLLILAGIWSLIGGLGIPRKPDSVWFGVTAVLCGGLFLYITVGPAEWGDLARNWPLFPLTAAAGWLAAWALDLRQASNLVAGVVALVVSGIGFMYTYGALGADTGVHIASLWPLILIVLGVGWIVQYLVQRR
ncbi:MAG: hypothetical protein FJZ90_04995 [Chloroflexi bacterium]|nr:hypothetical protein [Chloroflexota bacterium]